MPTDAPPPAALGPLEAAVMEVLWTEGDGTARTVTTLLREDAPRAYTTIMTTLDRLFQKGLLNRERDALAWRYRPAVTSAAYGRALAAERARVLVAEHGIAGLDAVAQAAAAVDPALLDHLVRLASERR